MSENKATSGYETSDVSSRKLFIATVVVIVFMVAIVLGLNSFFIASKEKQVKDVVLKPESAELRELRAREMEALNSYKILDERKGIVQIPIERAMKLLAEEAFEKQPRR